MILTNAALQSTGLLTIGEILELENPQLVLNPAMRPHEEVCQAGLMGFLALSVRSTSFKLEFGLFRFPLMPVVVLCCGRFSPIFPTSSAHQLLFLLLFPLLIFLQTPKQSLDLQQDVQKGLLFLDTFDCPIQKVDIGTTSWSHSS